MGMPLRNELYQYYKNNPNVVVTTVNINADSVSSVYKYFESNNYQIGVLFDEKQKFIHSIGIDGAPHSVILDKSGKVRRIYSGWSKDIDRGFLFVARKDIDQLLEEKL